MFNWFICVIFKHSKCRDGVGRERPASYIGRAGLFCSDSITNITRVNLYLYCRLCDKICSYIYLFTLSEGYKCALFARQSVKNILLQPALHLPYGLLHFHILSSILQI